MCLEDPMTTMTPMTMLISTFTFLAIQMRHIMEITIQVKTGVEIHTCSMIKANTCTGSTIILQPQIMDACNSQIKIILMQNLVLSLIHTKVATFA